MPDDKNNWFNPYFDKEWGEGIIEDVQKAVGCFECGAVEPNLRCSRCKLAKYCHQDCQKKDWKKQHKALCRTYSENKAPQESTPGACAPILLRSVGLLGETDFVKLMRYRRDSFLAAASKSPEPIHMGFSYSVIDMFDRLRVVAAPSFVDADCQEQIVPHILVEVVSEDQAAIEIWHSQGGKVTEAVFQKVVEIWVSFYDQLKEAKIQPASVTCGSGIFHRIDDFEAKLKAKGISDLNIMQSMA